MKCITAASLLCALLLLPAAASAADDDANKQLAAMNCPMMGHMASMQRNLGAIVKETGAMMSSTNDAALKERLQKVHDQLVDIMSGMGGMMGRGMGGGSMGGMMQQKPQGDTGSSPPDATPDEHKSHHPEQ